MAQLTLVTSSGWDRGENLQHGAQIALSAQNSMPWTQFSTLLLFLKFHLRGTERKTCITHTLTGAGAQIGEMNNWVSFSALFSLLNLICEGLEGELTSLIPWLGEVYKWSSKCMNQAQIFRTVPLFKFYMWGWGLRAILDPTQFFDPLTRAVTEL